MFSVNPISYDAVKTATMLSAVDPISGAGKGGRTCGDLPRRGPACRSVAADGLPGTPGQPQGQRGDQATGPRGRQGPRLRPERDRPGAVQRTHPADRVAADGSGEP